jgi:hypothetical protein
MDYPCIKSLTEWEKVVNHHSGADRKKKVLYWKEDGRFAGEVREGFTRSSLPDPFLIPSCYLPVTFLSF